MDGNVEAARCLMNRLESVVILLARKTVLWRSQSDEQREECKELEKEASSLTQEIQSLRGMIEDHDKKLAEVAVSRKAAYDAILAGVDNSFRALELSVLQRATSNLENRGRRLEEELSELRGTAKADAVDSVALCESLDRRVTTAGERKKALEIQFKHAAEVLYARAVKMEFLEKEVLEVVKLEEAVREMQALVATRRAQLTDASGKEENAIERNVRTEKLFARVNLEESRGTVLQEKTKSTVLEILERLKISVADRESDHNQIEGVFTAGEPSDENAVRSKISMTCENENNVISEEESTAGENRTDKRRGCD